MPLPELAPVNDNEPDGHLDLGGFHHLLESIRELALRNGDDEEILEDLMQRLQMQQGPSASTDGRQSPETIVEDWVRRYYA